MPLFDLFKKSPKKEPAKAPRADESLSSPEMQKKRYEAALEFLKSFQERLPLVGGKPHAGTVLAIAARLAGTSLYRSLNDKKDVPPGVIVLSEEVNEAWPQLMNLFAFYCKQNGMDVMAKPLVTAFPEKDKPLMSVDEVLKTYQDQYNEIMQRHGLDYLNAARAGMVICSIIFKSHTDAKDIDPYVATGIVAMGVVEGAKTAPPPMGSGNPSAPASGIPAQNNQAAELIKSIAQNSINGTGNRLVCGEGMTPMEEAVRSGGRYILLHPQVEKLLKQNNIDPFLMYETAMHMETSSKISQIDFVGCDVDALLRTWSGKPEGQAPIHVRQALWLQKNAGSLGYEKRGNSWILKQ